MIPTPNRPRRRSPDKNDFFFAPSKGAWADRTTFTTALAAKLKTTTMKKMEEDMGLPSGGLSRLNRGARSPEGHLYVPMPATAKRMEPVLDLKDGALGAGLEALLAAHLDEVHGVQRETRAVSLGKANRVSRHGVEINLPMGRDLEPPDITPGYYLLNICATLGRWWKEDFRRLPESFWKVALELGQVPILASVPPGTFAAVRFDVPSVVPLPADISRFFYLESEASEVILSGLEVIPTPEAEEMCAQLAHRFNVSEGVITSVSEVDPLPTAVPLSAPPAPEFLQVGTRQEPWPEGIHLYADVMAWKKLPGNRSTNVLVPRVHMSRSAINGLISLCRAAAMNDTIPLQRASPDLIYLFAHTFGVPQTRYGNPPDYVPGSMSFPERGAQTLPILEAALGTIPTQPLVPEEVPEELPPCELPLESQVVVEVVPEARTPQPLLKQLQEEAAEILLDCHKALAAQDHLKVTAAVSRFTLFNITFQQLQ